jgi:hypothetical protein
LPEGRNPVRKIPLVITGDEGEVHIDDIPDGMVGNGDGAGNGAGGFIDRPVRQQLLAIHSQLLGLTRADEELRASIQNLQIICTRQYQTMNSNIHRIAIQPARRVGGNGNDGHQQQQNNDVAVGNNGGIPTLSPTPRCLYILWQEYQAGIGGRKAATGCLAGCSPREREAR